MAFLVFDDLLSDFRFGFRGLRRSPAFTLAAIGVLAIGIGSSAAVFSVVDRLLFRSLPYPNSEQLVSTGIKHPIFDGEFLIANTYLYLSEHRQETPFSALASWTGVADCDLTEENPERLQCAQVDSSFLPTFGVNPEAGRSFTHDEDAPGARKVALISHALWRTRFGGERNVLRQNDPDRHVPTEIIGVLPADFELPTLQKVDLRRAAGARDSPLHTGRYRPPFAGVWPAARWHHGRTGYRGHGAVCSRMARRHSRSHAETGVVRPAPCARFSDSGCKTGLMDSVCNGACDSVDRLRERGQSACSPGRRRDAESSEMRLVLGAGRWRIVRQTLVESLLLSGLSAALGGMLAELLVRLFRILAPAGLPRIEQATVDTRVLLFLIAAAILCGIAAGLAPALGGVRLETLGGWRAAGAVSRSGLIVRRLLITAQIALSLTLLSDAGLLVESLRRITRPRPWLGRRGPGDHRRDYARNGSPSETRKRGSTSLRQTIAGRLRANPMITSVAVSDTVPPSGFIHNKPIAALEVIWPPGSRRTRWQHGFLAQGFARILYGCRRSDPSWTSFHSTPIATGPDHGDSQQCVGACCSEARTPLGTQFTSSRKGPMRR